MQNPSSPDPMTPVEYPPDPNSLDQTVFVADPHYRVRSPTLSSTGN